MQMSKAWWLFLSHQVSVPLRRDTSVSEKVVNTKVGVQKLEADHRDTRSAGELLRITIRQRNERGQCILSFGPTILPKTTSLAGIFLGL